MCARQEVGWSRHYGGSGNLFREGSRERRWRAHEGATEQIPGRSLAAGRRCGHYASGSQARSLPPGAGELWAAGLGQLGAPPPAPHAALGSASSPQPLENRLVERLGGLRPKDPGASQAGEAGSPDGIAAPRAERGGKQLGSLSRRNARHLPGLREHSAASVRLSAGTGEEHAARASTWPRRGRPPALPPPPPTTPSPRAVPTAASICLGYAAETELSNP